MATKTSAEIDFHDALVAIREAVSLPYAATVGDSEKRLEQLNRRTMHVSILLDALLDDIPKQLAKAAAIEADNPIRAEVKRESAANRAAWAVRYLREQVANDPPNGYLHAPPIYGQEENGYLTVKSGCECGCTPKEVEL